MFLDIFYIVGLVSTVGISGLLQGKENYRAKQEEDYTAKPMFFAALFSPLWPLLWLAAGCWFLWRVLLNVGEQEGFVLNAEMASLRHQAKLIQQDHARILEEILIKGYGYKEITASSIAHALDDARGQKLIEEEVLKGNKVVDISVQEDSDELSLD